MQSVLGLDLGESDESAMTLNLEVRTCDSVLEGGDKRTPQLSASCTMVIYLFYFYTYISTIKNEHDVVANIHFHFFFCIWCSQMNLLGLQILNCHLAKLLPLWKLVMLLLSPWHVRKVTN